MALASVSGQVDSPNPIGGPVWQGPTTLLDTVAHTGGYANLITTADSTYVMGQVCNNFQLHLDDIPTSDDGMSLNMTVIVSDDANTNLITLGALFTTNPGDTSGSLSGSDFAVEGSTVGVDLSWDDTAFEIDSAAGGIYSISVFVQVSYT